MSDYSVPPVAEAEKAAAPTGRVWPLYARLLGYAWAYKTRLLVSFFFAFVVAGSFGLMIGSTGVVVNTLFLDEPAFAAQIEGATAKLGNWLPAGAVASIQEAAWNLWRRGQTDPMHVLWLLSGTLLGLTMLAAAARYIQEYFAGAIGAHVSVKLAEEMYRNIIRQPLSFFERHPSGEFTTRLTNDVLMVNRGLSGVVVKLLREPFIALFLLAVALAADWQLTLIGLFVLPPVAVVIVLIGKQVRRSAQKSMKKLSSMQTLAKESVTGMAIVKGFCMEGYLLSRMRAEMRKLDRYLVRLVRADAAVGPVTEVLLTLGLVVFLLLGAAKVVNGAMTPGAFSSLYLAFAALLNPIRKLTNVNNQIQTSMASAQRVFEYIDMEPDIREAPDAIDIPPLREAIRFNDVHFAYDGASEVIRGVNLEVRKGEMVALVGFSGAGKSTLAKLVPRFYDVTRGSITIDGVDIRRATFKSLRGQIGIVTQDSILFSETIAGNIAFGKDDFPPERIRAAAEAAHAAEFIESVPGGYDAPVAEGGVSLSGGQRQRLAIARAIVKDPAILILDEATSSLDSESERAIQQAMDEFVVGRTTLVIAHRLSTIQRADRIVVLDAGRVVEQGTHHELLRKGGIYQRLYEIQFNGPPEKVA